MSKLPRIMLGATTALIAGAALSAEITFFDRPDFQGERMTLNSDVPNFDRTNFNDRASSVVVRDGAWEICTDANFRGQCVQLQPGRYPNLSGSMNGSISSVRQVAASPGYGAPPPRSGSAPSGPGYGPPPSAGYNPPPGPGYGPPPSAGYNSPPGPAYNSPSGAVRGNARATLFEGPDFRGRSFPIDHDVVRNLDRTNFNDRAQSLRVDAGYWIFCSDAEFEGDCQTFGPGDYPDLSGALNRRISSGRRISDRYPYSGPPSWDRDRR
jgi:hypothetical protein